MRTRKHILIILFAISLFIVSIAQSADTIIGKVVSISDGDTITVLDANKTQHKIRLFGVDCPESHQDFGQKAKDFTAGMVFGKDVSVKVMDTDRYGRTVGIVNVNATSLNEELLKNGMAWYYAQYCKSSFCAQWVMVDFMHIHIG